MREWIGWLIIGQSTAPATKAMGVSVYAVAAALCLWALRGGARRQRIIWGALAGMQLLLLGNVRWDWGFALADMAREAAVAEHWYQQRGAVLPWIVLGISGFLLGALAATLGMARPVRWPAMAAFVGTTLSALIQGLQAISWHATDMSFYRMAGPVMVVAWLWLLGAACTCGGALAATRGGYRFAVLKK